MTDEKRIEEAGLAGFVARSAKVLNELDITRVHTMDGTQYQGSSDFISDTDLKDVQHADMHESATEESAVPLLMAPVRRTDGEVLGVLYALQKTTAIDDGGLQYFDQADERGMIELAAEFGRTLQRIEKVESDANVISDLETLFHCSPEMLSESDLRRLTRIISRDVCRITNAQHCSTYLVDHESQEVWTQVEGLRRQIRLPMNNGLVGQVATNGDLVKIDDASQLNGVLVGDTSEVVQSVICCPIMGRKMKSMAVIQAFHAKSNFFTAHHVSMVQRIAKFASIALQNRAMLEMKASAVHRGLSIEMNRSRMHKEMSILLKEHLKCENVVLHEFVSPWDVLSSLGADGSFHELPASIGVVGSVATSANAVMSEFAETLPGFDKRIDRPLSANETKTLLCTPMVDSSGSKIGCILAVNKKRGAFTLEEDAWLKIMSAQYGEILSNFRKHQTALSKRDYYAAFLNATRDLGGIASLSDLIVGIERTVKKLMTCRNVYECCCEFIARVPGSGHIAIRH